MFNLLWKWILWMWANIAERSQRRTGMEIENWRTLDPTFQLIFAFPSKFLIHTVLFYNQRGIFTIFDDPRHARCTKPSRFLIRKRTTVSALPGRVIWLLCVCVCLCLWVNCTVTNVTQKPADFMWDRMMLLSLIYWWVEKKRLESYSFSTS